MHLFGFLYKYKIRQAEEIQQNKYMLWNCEAISVLKKKSGFTKPTAHC